MQVNKREVLKKGPFKLQVYIKYFKKHIKRFKKGVDIVNTVVYNKFKRLRKALKKIKRG